MPSKKYFLDDTKTNQIQLIWKGAYRETQVLYNDQPMATLTRDEITAGKSIPLPDGRNLDLKLDVGFFAALNVKIDGRHVPGTQGDPVYQLKQIFYLFIFLGILNIGLGLFFALADLRIDNVAEIGYTQVAIGAVYILLGYFISKGNMLSLIVAAILMFADLVMAAMYSAQTKSTAPIILKVMIMIFILRGFKYMKEYNAQKDMP